eukprot:2186784-Prorocentrum_lima.AAC.1
MMKKARDQGHGRMGFDGDALVCGLCGKQERTTHGSRSTNTNTKAEGPNAELTKQTCCFQQA